MRYITDDDSHYQPSFAEGLSYELLNALLPEHGGWRTVTARKRHEDLFGDEVHAGDRYYARDAGAGFGEVLKLSLPSMDRVLVATFFSNPGLHEFAVQEMNRRREQLAALIRTVRTKPAEQ